MGAFKTLIISCLVEELRVIINLLKSFNPTVQKGRSLLLPLVFLLTLAPLYSQIVEIPREGFPYCEPFTGFGPFKNTLLGGEIRNNISVFFDPNGWAAQPNGQSLSLTPNEYWHSGYVIVDIPFSSLFGIKTSFEYFTYGGDGADGISFFMFDADVPFDLGYLGGSLGYAPLIGLDGSVLQPGISGGYIGIGFDEKGNFGNGTVGEPIANWAGQVGNSVSIRAPQSQNYDLWNRDVTVPFIRPWVTYNPPFPSNDHFTITSDVPFRVTDCNQPGYRKVFIELDPAPIGYKVKITMLVNTSANGQRVVTFPTIDYPFPAPPRLKIGFAGATGFQKNHHEIRNVTVNVSDTANISEPRVNNQSGVICVGDSDLEMEFKVQLATSDAFVTCLQLFNNSPGSPDNSLPPTNYLACGLDDTLCRNKCNPDNYELKAYDSNGNFAGTFYSELQDLNTGNFNQLRDVVNVKFVPAPGFVGQASVFYNVTDNYGLTSEPGIITVTANPYPVINPAVNKEPPTCNGQNDGKLSGLSVSSLVSGFDYEWFYNGVSIGKTGATMTYNSGTQTAVFGLNGLNLGTYTLQVWNTSSSGGCYESIDVIIDQELGTPVEVVLDDQEICEGTPVTFTPELKDPTDASNPSFTWWKDNNKTQKITHNLTEGNVKYEILSPGILTVTGLAERATPYEFFVEAAADPTQNLCNTPVGQLKKVQVKVLPPLTLASTTVDDLCREGKGSISVNASGGFGSFVYSLNGGPAQSSNTFSGLFPGTYTIQVSAGTNCIGVIISEVKAAPEINFELKKVIQPACGESNGLLELNFSSGTPPYTLEFFKGGFLIETSSSAASPKVYQNLSPGTYEIRLKDAISCTKILSQTLINSDGISISVSPMVDEICLGDVAKLTPVVTTAGSAELKWYKNAAATQEIVSSTNPDANGHVFSINSSTQELTVGGLKTGDYQFYLVATGPGYCPNPPFIANIKVIEPISANVDITDEICFGAKDGTLTVNASGADGNFEYSLNNGPFVSSNVFYGLGQGTYTVDIRSKGDNGCVFQTTAIVNGPPAAISVNTPTFIRSSCDLDNGRIENLVISGGWGSYSVEWRRGAPTGPIVTGDLSGSEDLFADTYFLIVTDQKGCTKTFDFRVEEMPDPVFVVAPVEICAGDQIVLKPVNTVSGSAPTDLVWYKDAGKTLVISNGPDSVDASILYSIDPLTGNLTIQGLEANNLPYSYYLHVICTDAVVKADALVRVVPNPVFETGPVSCFGGNDGKIFVNGGGDPKFRFSVDGGTPITESQLEALNFTAKTYSISVTNEGFCVTNFSVEVKQPLSALKVETLQKVDPSCGSDIGIIRTQVTGGWSPYSITLVKAGIPSQTKSFPGPNIEFSNLSPGTYSLQITDSEGCQISSNSITMAYGPTTIQVNDVEICEGEDAVFKPIAVPVAIGATFQWFKNSALTVPIVSSPTPDSNGQSFNIASDGTLTVSGLKSSDSPVTYYVRISGGNSCPGFVASASAIINRKPILTAQIKNEVCFGEKARITLVGSAGDGAFTFSLDGVNFQSSNIFDVVPGLYTGYVKSGSGCLVTLPNLEVKGPSSPFIVGNPTKQNSSCNAADGVISFEVGGGYNSTYSVLTKRNGADFSTNVITEGTFTLSNLPSGDYTITITDAGGCVLTLPGSIEIDDLPTPISANNEVICEGETASLIPSTTQSGITPIFTWYLNSDGTGQIQTGTNNGVSYQIGNEGTLNISGLQGRVNPYVYYLKVSGVGVCEPSLLPVEVLVYDIPNLRVSNPSIVCDPKATVDLTQFIEGFDPSRFDYNILSPSGVTMRLEDIDSVNQSGSYQVQSSVKGSNCWTPNQRIQVLIADEELIPDFVYEADWGRGNFIPNSEAQIFEQVIFSDSSSGNVILWNWDFGDGNGSNQQNPTHIYEKKGTYTVTLNTIDSIGCIAEIQKVITVLDDFKIIIPNAFTPRGNKNQYFKPEYLGIASMEFYIFSTWGELIFQTNSMETKGWDGTLNGKDAPNGNYVYRGKFTSRSGEVVEKTGVFILIR